MQKGMKKISKKKLIIILASIAVIAAAVALIVHQTTKITNESYLKCALGDVNGDGYINSMDALLVIEGNNDSELLFDSQKKLADVNSDGNCDSSDALVLLRYTVGEINKLPYIESRERQKEALSGNRRSADCNTEKTYSSVQIINEWDNGDGTHSYQLSLTVKNTGKSDIESWNSKIQFSSPVSISKNWDCKAKTNSDEITVTGEAVPAESAAACGLIITSVDGLKINSITTND